MAASIQTQFNARFQKERQIYFRNSDHGIKYHCYHNFTQGNYFSIGK